MSVSYVCISTVNSMCDRIMKHFRRVYPASSFGMSSQSRWTALTSLPTLLASSDCTIQRHQPIADALETQAQALRDCTILFAEETAWTVLFCSCTRLFTVPALTLIVTA